jgi:hypothetical protein
MQPTAARLYARMRDWFAEAIEAGVERGEFRSGIDPARVADRIIALSDGYGVRVLFGDMDIEHARGEMWATVRDELGLPELAPPPLWARARACPRRSVGLDHSESQQ